MPAGRSAGRRTLSPHQRTICGAIAVLFDEWAAAGQPTIPARGAFEAFDIAGRGERDRRDPRLHEQHNMDQQPLQQRDEDRRHGDGGAPTRIMRTQPMPLRMPAWAPPRAPGPVRRFAIRFLAVLGYYALGVCTFSVMAAGNVPGGGDVSQLIWRATENTGLIALAAALAAGCWRV